MLVIFSDIHLTDGRAASNVHPDTFKNVLRQEILSKKNIKEIDIVMLGDIFDLVRTDYWMCINRNERPWNGILDKSTAVNNNPKVESHYQTVLKKIIGTESSLGFLDMLIGIKRCSPVPVKITYVIGNHDRAIGNFASLQEIVRSELSAYHPDEVIFANEFACYEYAAICRHGHEYDESNFGLELYKEMNNIKHVSRLDPKIYRVQSIGEVITAELMSGLIWRLSGELGSNNRFVEITKGINNVRPMSNAIKWLKWKSECADGVYKYRSLLLKAFKDSLSAVLNTELAKAWDYTGTDLVFPSSGDLTDKLSRLAEVTENSGFENLSDLVNTFECFSNLYKKILPEEDNHLRAARQVLSGDKNKDKQYLIMGHTHEAMNSCLSSDKSNKVKMYINTGTYLPLIQMTSDGRSSAAAGQMTMVFVYGKEEGGPSVEVWNGARMISDFGLRISD